MVTEIIAEMIVDALASNPVEDTKDSPRGKVRACIGGVLHSFKGIKANADLTI